MQKNCTSGLPLTLLKPGACLSLCLLLAGCGRDEIRVYEVSKEKEPPAAPAPRAANAPASMPRLKWDKLPAGWTEGGAPSGMRAASFSVQGESGQRADIAVIALPGMGENDLEFVNMWRKQIGLGPVEEKDLARHRESVPIAGSQGKLFNMQAGDAPAEPAGSAVLVALAVRDGVSWFFKFSGDAPLLRSQRPAFLSFLNEISFAPADASTPMSAAGGPGVGGPASGAPAGARPAWDVPAGWKETPPGQMLLAKFVATGEGGAKVDVTVSSFPGDVGGLLANVNRWRGQVGLGPLASDGLAGASTPLALPEGQGTVVDFSGTDSKTGQPARIVGVVVPRGGETWFYKLMGDPALSEREKPGLLKFVQSAKYGVSR